MILELILSTAISLFETPVRVSESLHQNNKNEEVLNIQYRLQKSSFGVHEPVVLIFSARNGLKRSVTIDLGVDKLQSFHFGLKTPDGRSLEGKSQPDEGFYPSGKIPLRPGEAYEQQLVLNEWFRFDSPGIYLLTAGLSTKIGVEDGTSVLPDSQTVTLQITGRSSERLQAICRKLTSQIANAATMQEASNPAMLLSQIEDPVAVPYLVQTLSFHKGVEAAAIQGLERIASRDAVEALLSALQDPFGDTKNLAQRALSRLQGRIADPDLRGRVGRALIAEQGGGEDHRKL